MQIRIILLLITQTLLLGFAHTANSLLIAKKPFKVIMTPNTESGSSMESDTNVMYASLSSLITQACRPTELLDVAAAAAAVFGGHNCSEFCWKKEPPDDLETHRSEVICVFQPLDDLETDVICWFCLITTKWCLAQGCDYAVEFIVGSGSYDVTVRCSYGFFWNCTEEAHHRVDCGTVAKWILKNSTESENMNWLCLWASTEHGERSGRFSACNRYKAAKQEGMVKLIQDWRLHQCADKELQRHLCVEEGPSKDFNHFRTKFASL